MTLLIAALLACPAAAFLVYRWQRHRAATTGPAAAGDVAGIGGPLLTAPDRGSDDRRLGYRYADDRIFINGDGVYTGVLLAGDTDEFATTDQTGDRALRQVAIYRDLLTVMDGRPVHCHELLRYRTPTGGWLTQLLEHAWHPTRTYRVLAGKVAGHVARATPQRVWALIVRLGDAPPATAPTDPYAAATAAITGVADDRITDRDLTGWWDRADTLHELLARYGARPLTRRDLLWLIRKPGHGHLPPPDDPLTSRRPWRGGHFELAATLRGRNLGGGYVQLLARDPDTGEDHTSYTATLVVANQPPRVLFNPRDPWARRLSRLPVPAEISWRHTLIPPPAWKRLTGKAIDNVDDEATDRDKAGADTDPAFEIRLDQAAQLRVDTADGADAPPGMVGRLRITVSAATPQLLARAVQDVRTAMGDIDMQVPPHGALPLLLEQLPGEPATGLGALSAGPAGGLALWRRWSDTYLPAIGLLGSHNQTGDQLQVERGRTLGWIDIPIGWVKSNGTPVHHGPHAQIARGHGAGIAVLGSSGGGKTSLALLMFFWLSESGVRCSALDPKIDFAGFLHYLCFGPQVLDPGFAADADRGVLGTPGSRFQPVNRQLWDETEIVDLARGARGTFDPWRNTGTFHDGYTLALNLADVLVTDPGQRGILRRGLRGLLAAHTDAGRDFRCGLGDVLDIIRADHAELTAEYQTTRDRGGDTGRLRETSDQYDDVCTRLENGQHVPFLRLLLGRGADPPPAPRAGTIRRVIYTLAGYKTPDHPTQPELWTDEDRNAAAAMLAVLSKMRADNLTGRLDARPGTGEMAVPPTAAFIDEGNMVTAQAAGRAYLTVNLRQGRSLNSALYFLDQQARGIKAIEDEARRDDTAEVNQFGTVAVFRQRSRREALSALEVLRSGDDTDPGERDLLARKLQAEEVGGLLRPGDCALRDPDSRVAAVTVDLMFTVLQRASQTNPSLKAVDWAHPVPADPADWDINPDTLLRVRTSIAADPTGPADPDPADGDPSPDAAGFELAGGEPGDPAAAAAAAAP